MGGWKGGVGLDGNSSFEGRLIGGVGLDGYGGWMGMVV